jgi:putative ABC transport system substrate-binding protein
MEGQNLLLDWRNLENEEAARATALEFVRDRVDLIVAFENQTVRAAQAATSAIPVVFLHVDDPVAQGLVASLAHPGRNLTGFVTYVASPAKWLELLRDIAPQIRRVLILIDPLDPVTERVLAEARLAGATLHLELVEREVVSAADIERLFSAMQPGDVDGILILSPNLRSKFTALVLRLASERRLPLASHQREWVEQGALFSYALDVAWVGVPAARYVDRILQGTKPSDLPVDQAMRFELVINFTTAQALGLTIPQHVLLQATEIIQ